LQEKKRVLVIGASGKLGSELIEGFENSKFKNEFDVTGTSKSSTSNRLLSLDITEKEKVQNIFENVKPNIVILSAALTYAEYCEEQPELAKKINVEGTKNIVEFCKIMNCKLIFLSSDYVFDGKTGPYSENSVTNPLNILGKTKVEAEKIVQKMDEHIIIRTAWVNDINKGSKSYALHIINSLKENKEIKAPIDQFGHPTLASNLCEIIIELCLKNKKGIFHVTGLTYLSRYEFAVEIAKAFGLNHTLIKGVKSPELKQKALRPKNVELNLNKITTEITIKILSLREQLEIMRAQYEFKTSINDIELIPISQFIDQRGTLAVLASKGRTDAPNVKEIQEVYVSMTAEKGIIRAKHKHKKLDEYFIILDGSAKFVLVDDRKNSSTFQHKSIFFLNSNYQFALFVPAEIYHAFITLNENTKCLAIANKAYDKNLPDTFAAPDSIFDNLLTL